MRGWIILPSRSGELIQRSHASHPTLSCACSPKPYCRRAETIITWDCFALSQAAPLPCDAGSFSSATDNDEATDCTAASAGYFATTGSTEQTKCAKGTYTDASTDPKDKCTACAGGTYQDTEGATACKACEAGSYCPLGAAAPLPCNGGTFSSATDNDKATDCTVVDAGHFAATVCAASWRRLLVSLYALLALTS